MKCPSCQTDNPADSKFCKECATPLPASRPSSPLATETLEAAPQELTTGSLFARRDQVIEEAGAHFITMEYVPGQDLRGLIRQTGQLTVGKAIAIGKEICEGLAGAHRQGSRPPR